MNADPYIPLPTENDNKPLVITQLMMLWIIWGTGLTAGFFAFIGEHLARKMAWKSLPVADYAHTATYQNYRVFRIEQVLGPKLIFVTGLVIFVTAVARLVG